MTREEAKSCIGTIEMLQRLAYNIHGVMDVIDADNCKKIIKALEQEPTTRNCFGCKYSKDNHNAGTEECHLCMWENQYTPTTKNDLGVDCISREDARKAIIDHQYSDGFCEEHNIDHSINTSMALIVLGDLPSVTPQEPFINKSCVSSEVCEHDKQKMLDKIRAEIIEKYWYCDICKYNGHFNIRGDINDILQIIDKYKAESEDNND